MASFFRDVISNANRTRENAIKESLINNLSECVKDIQFNNQSERNIHRVLGSDDSTNSLCTALEAIFLHGLKDNLFRKAKIAFGGDMDQRPQPNFWPLVMMLSHRQSIEQISSLSQITTDIGQCRAWVRLALNDCLLSSYLSTLIRNIGMIKSFYNHTAFIRDVEILDVVQRLIEGLESCSHFNLPTNSSLLNTWPEQVLIMIGIWMPTLKSCPITTGVDIASTLEDNQDSEKDLPMAVNRAPITGLGQMLALNEDEAINYILSQEPTDSPKDIDYQFLQKSVIEPSSSQNQSQDAERVSPLVPHYESPPLQESPQEKTDDVENTGKQVVSSGSSHDLAGLEVADKVMGNSLSGKVGWSSENAEELINSTISNSSHSSEPIFTPQKSKSLLSLTDSASLLGGSYDNTPNIHDMMKELHKELRLNIDDNDNQNNEQSVAPTTSDDPLLEGLGFEVVSHSLSSSFNMPELQLLIKQLVELSREKGLDSQSYKCKGCRDMLGTTVSKAKVCSFSGEYYCSDCMDPNVFIIPARVVHNWDFHRYPVSKRSATFLLEFQHHPLIDVKKTNPLMYSGVESMYQLRTLRIQLNFLKAYLFTCREPIIEDFQKRLWPREYLYEHVHVYSISDLEQISNGSLLQQLEKIVLFARAHVKECWLCSQKGFICEICNDPKVLYPFNTSSTYRCEECSSVFHSKCVAPHIPCPKCERRKKRLDVSLMDAVYNIG